MNPEHPDISAPSSANVKPTTRRFTETEVNENVDRTGITFIRDQSLLKAPPLANLPQVRLIYSF